MKTKYLSVFFAFALLTVLLIIFWIGGLIMGNSTSDILSKNAPADYVIILGCSLEGEEPGKTLSQRIDAAVQYLRAHPFSMAVCSGGQGTDEVISEAQAISNALQKKGVHKRRIILEDKSHNTYENLTFTKEILDKRKGEIPYKVLIATSDYHVYRTRRLANYVGFTEPAVLSAKSTASVFYRGFIREIPAVIRSYIIYR